MRTAWIMERYVLVPSKLTMQFSFAWNSRLLLFRLLCHTFRQRLEASRECLRGLPWTDLEGGQLGKAPDYEVGRVDWQS